MKKLAIASLALTLSFPVFSWGDREQGALIGAIVGATIANSQNRSNQEPRHYSPAPVYVMPPAHQPQICGMNVVCAQQQGRTCLQHPMTDQYGRIVGYQLSCH